MSERTTMNGKPVFSVPAKSIINFKSGFAHKLLCDGPTFSAGSACAYSCSFCYVPAIMRKSTHMAGTDKPHEEVVVRRNGAVEAMRKQLLSHNKASRDTRKVIYASPLVDVAANMELVRETANLCEQILTLTNWDIRLLSKSNLLPKIAAELDTLHQWRPRERVIYGVSTGTLDDKLAQAFEEGCPLVSKRVQSLHWLQDNGFRTYAMVCPSLPMSPLDYDDFARQCAEALRYDKCEHVWAEVINVRGESFSRTYNALRHDGFGEEAEFLEVVSKRPEEWEQYARNTFEAHANHCPPEKLRFLQYVNNGNRDYWTANKDMGAVLL